MTPLLLRSNPILKLSPLNLPQRFSPPVFALATYLSSSFAFSLPRRHAKLRKSPCKHVKNNLWTLPPPHLASAPCTEGLLLKERSDSPAVTARLFLPVAAVRV